MHVLLVEDDDRLACALAAILSDHQHRVLRLRDLAGARMVDLSTADLGIVDLGLPDGDGRDLLARFRDADVPVIVTTARRDLADRVSALYGGADDYVVKPYHIRELLARMAVVSRRATSPATRTRAETVRPHRGATDIGVPADRRDGDPLGTRISISPVSRQAAVDGRPVTLTRKEFDVLLLLFERGGEVVRREHLLRHVWAGAGSERTLEVHVASLRSKLGDPELIATVRGIGYRLTGS